MNREDRAKQFLPFDALKGLQEELRRREEMHNRVEKREPDEDEKAELCKAIRQAEKGMTASVIYYEQGRYLSLSGKITSNNMVYGFLEIDGKKLFYDDLYELKYV